MNKDEIRKLASAILKQGYRRFNAMLGIVSRIDSGNYEIFAVASDTGIPEVGDTYPLNAVYCRDVVAGQRTIAITEINGVAGLRLHPLYDSIPCEFYISSPILVDGRVWGTLNYTSLAKRKTPFSAEDIAYNETAALQIGAALSAG